MMYDKCLIQTSSKHKSYSASDGYHLKTQMWDPSRYYPTNLFLVGKFTSTPFAPSHSSFHYFIPNTLNYGVSRRLSDEPRWLISSDTTYNFRPSTTNGPSTPVFTTCRAHHIPTIVLWVEDVLRRKKQDE
ncbi:hypothetical protein YC2023_092478 [Brassica napus]